MQISCVCHVHFIFFCVDFICVWYPTQTQFPVEYGLKSASKPGCGTYHYYIRYFSFTGDFAVLLQSGMTVKQALFYNIVSSVLCFIGMAIGVAVGNIGEASLWIFAMTAGTFIYISLVDMVSDCCQS